MHKVSLIRGGLCIVITLACALSPLTSSAAEINFTVQPILTRDATMRAFKPLADYIAKNSGKQVNFSVAMDYADYWYKMKINKTYNLVLDSAHYVDYRIKHQDHVPLVKVPGVVSYSLVALSSEMILETSELVGKKIATLIPPAPGGLVLGELFPVALRQPYVMPVQSSEKALNLLMEGKVNAAIIPTPLAARAMAEGKEISTIATTPQIPHITLTAGPDIDEGTRNRITQALLNATKNRAGKTMLKQIGFPQGFEKTTARLYDGYSNALEQTWSQ